MAEERESFESQWAPSDVTEENLKEMVAHGILLAKEIIRWRPAYALPEYSCLPPVYQDTWNLLSMRDEAAQALALMDRMLKLKEQGLQGEQITRHFIKSRLAPIKERSRMAFEFNGKHDPNREDPESLEFKIMKERMYKIFSNAIVVSYSHLLPVVPYNAFNPPPPEFALMKSDPPIAQRRSPRWKTIQASGGPKIRSVDQPDTSKSTNQSDSRKRKLVVSDDEGDDAEKAGSKGETGKQPRQANPKKKTSSRPIPKIRKSSRKPSNIDPSGKDPEPTDTVTGPSKETGPTAEDCPSDNQPATDNVETSNEPPTGNQSAEAGVGVNQEPPTGNQPSIEQNNDIPEVEAQANSPPKKDASADPGSSSPVRVQGPACPRPEVITGPMNGDEEEILRIQSAEDSRPPILVKWWDDEMRPQGIVINKQKEDEEVCLLKKTLDQATRLVNRIHLRNEAKTTTLEKLVPHLGSLEATRDQLHEAKELARKTKHDLRDRIAELQDSNFELSGSSKVQASKISELEKRIQALEKDKAELAKKRDSALKDVEDRKIKSQAQFDVLVNKIKKLEGARDEVANVATPLVQAMFFNNNGLSSLDAVKSFDKLRAAPDTYFKNIKEAGSMGAGLALAMTKSLYPRIDIDAVDGFADGTSEDAALDLISDAQKAADKIAADVVERFQDNDLKPTGSDNSDDEKTESN
uniref:Retrotransposon protein, putative, unclassified n=1 Tax=Oryza sativa subsp. japonica TaxID=39947 RepID=Q2QXM8_ORYSJ|nr:retrotransposon protein, putative, unclassified [Oryza sativa Japonica Group]